jgi:hypothetical protein
MRGAGKIRGKLSFRVEIPLQDQEAGHSCLAKKTGKNACPPDFAVLLALSRGGVLSAMKMAVFSGRIWG